MIKQAVLALIGSASLIAPAAASAQTYYAQGYYGHGYGEYGRGDYYGGDRRFAGYPEFRGIEQHIRGEIQDGLREDLIEPDDARELFAQLRDIQNQEAREFRVHRWNLPQDDRYRIRARLDELDRLVDEIRAEPED